MRGERETHRIREIGEIDAQRRRNTYREEKRFFTSKLGPRLCYIESAFLWMNLSFILFFFSALPRASLRV